MPNSVELASKFTVRQFVSQRVGDHILNELYHVARTPEQIDFAALPDRFVIKMSNASKRNIFVEDKRMADFDQIAAKLTHWLRVPFGRMTGEDWYLDIEPLILVERFMRDGASIPWDYCFHSFNGEVRYIETQVDRYNQFSSNWYDRQWNLTPIRHGDPNGPFTPPPTNLDAMITVAEQLAADLEYVRVDLYSIGGRQIVFRELTLTPGTGVHTDRSPGTDALLSSLW